MKLAYLVSEYPKRSHTFIRREIAELRKRGAKIHIFSIRRPSKSELICEQDWHDFHDTWSILPTTLINFIKVHLKLFLSQTIPYGSTLKAAFQHRNPGIKNSIWSIFSFAEAVLLADQIQKLKISHLHVHFANVGADIGYLVSNFTKCSWSMNLHGACDFEYPAGPLLGKKLESVSFANCASNYGRAQAFRVVDYKHWEKLFISRCGIEFEALPKPMNKKSNNNFQIICVGRFSSEKGHLGLIEACTKVFNKFEKIELLLIGDGPERDKIEYKINKNEIASRVTLTGNIAETDVLKQLSNADLFALPSLMEGIPLVLMEAMAMNLPVVAPRLAGIPELVEDKIGGFLYTPGDWSEMAEKIIQLIEDEALSTKLADNGRTKVLSEYIVSKSVEPLWRRLSSYTK